MQFPQFGVARVGRRVCSFHRPKNRRQLAYICATTSILVAIVTAGRQGALAFLGSGFGLLVPRTFHTSAWSVVTESICEGKEKEMKEQIVFVLVKVRCSNSLMLTFF